jgi:hypothetical protein
LRIVRTRNENLEDRPTVDPNAVGQPELDSYRAPWITVEPCLAGRGYVPPAAPATAIGSTQGNQRE